MAGWIAKGISSAITGFFKSVIKFALNPLLELISNTLLTTPNPTSMPRVGALWTNSWQIALAGYVLLVTIAGVVVMSHESVQTRYSIKEIGPRIPLGFLAAGLSLFLAGKAVDLANALSRTATGTGVDADTAGPALRDFVLSSFQSDSGNLFGVLMWVVVIVVLVAVLMTFVVRVALTVILVVAAPLALICHALPQTDGIARWWWKAFGGVLVIQVAQSLALITGVRVFLTPGGFGPTGLFGLTNNGLVNVLITLALMYIVFKIPFWILGSIRFSHGRSFVGSTVRAYAMYKTLGFLRGGHGVGSASRVGGRRTPPPSPGPGGATWSPHPNGSGPSPGNPARRTSASPSPTTAGQPNSTRRQPPGQPQFLSPIPEPTQASRPPIPAAGPPPMPEFRAPSAPGADAPSPPPPRSRTRPPHPPGQPVFRPSISPRTPRPSGRPPAPSQPRFQEPTPQPRTPPRRAATPPAPAVFRPPVPEPVPVRPRRSGSAPPPSVFRSPPPRNALPKNRASGTYPGGEAS
ncbi:hypothetical protein ACFUEN_29845 [Streptomyces griseorubiginosus]|uniref:hypothetical protein n=1 Tax=Streptomyces TaxID=1883 RepID=UPI0033D960D1